MATALTLARFARGALMTGAAAVSLAFTCPALADDGAAMILQAYRARDAAYGRADSEGMLETLGPSLTVITPRGTMTMDRAAQLAASRSQFRQVPGQTFVRRENTRIGSMNDSGGNKTVTGTLVEELDATDRNGTKAHVVQTVSFVDTWSLLPEGWRQVSTRQTGLSRTGTGSPSPAAVAALANMRRTVAAGQAAIANMRESGRALREFNAANNYSECMTATRNQKYDEYTRQQNCR